MKKHLLIAIFGLVSFGMYAQTVITGWDFPASSGPDSLNANQGLTANKSYDLRFQYALSPTSDSTINTIVFTEGASTFAAATSNWDNGANLKFWSAKFKANGYSNFKLSSRQKSDPVIPGPRDFKVQWRLSNTSYADVPNGTVTVGGNWTSGVLTELPVPIADQGSNSIYIRWIMTSNTDINGGTVSQGAQSMIDDILVTAVSSTGQDEILFTNRLNLYPSPNHGTFTISSREPLAMVRVTDLYGKTLFSMPSPPAEQKISLPDPKPGVYFLQVQFTGEERELTKRFVID